MQLYTQLTFTCSTSTIEALEKGVNMFKLNNKNTRTRSMTFSGVFIVTFEHNFAPYSSVPKC